MPSLRAIPWDIYEEHLDEAAFLWFQWQRAMDAANYTLDEVINGPEERLLAHLDGLVLGGKDVARRVLIPGLADDNAGKVWAAAWALLQAEDEDWLDLVMDALITTKNKDASVAIGRALELTHRNDLSGRLPPLMAASSLDAQTAIVNVLVTRMASSVHTGLFATIDVPLEDLLQTPHPDLVVAALRALRRAPDRAFAPLVEMLLASSCVAIRDSAIEVGMLLGMGSAWRTCIDLVALDAPNSRLPLSLLALGGEPADVKAIATKLEVEPMRHDALWALGYAGTLEAADASLAMLGDEDLARLAGEAFSTISGVSMEGALVQSETSDNAAPQNFDDDEAPLPVLRPEADLRMPEPARVRAMWEKLRPSFQPEARYLYGKVATGDRLRQAITMGPTWRRPLWCLEIAMRGGPDLEVGTWGRSQTTTRGGPLERGRGDLSLPSLKTCRSRDG